MPTLRNILLPLIINSAVNKFLDNRPIRPTGLIFDFIKAVYTADLFSEMHRLATALRIVEPISTYT